MVLRLKQSQERIMRKEEGVEEHDTTMHLIKFQVFTHATNVNASV